MLVEPSAAEGDRDHVVAGLGCAEVVDALSVTVVVGLVVVVAVAGVVPELPEVAVVPVVAEAVDVAVVPAEGEVGGDELDVVLPELVRGGVVVGETPPEPEPPGDPPAPVVGVAPDGLVVVGELAPPFEASDGFEPDEDGGASWLMLAEVVEVAPPGEPVAGRVVADVVGELLVAGTPLPPGELPAGLVSPGTLVPVGDVVARLVGVSVGELPAPELPGLVLGDEITPGLDAPAGELVLGAVLGEPPAGPLRLLDGVPPGDVPLGLVVGEVLLRFPPPGEALPGLPVLPPPGAEVEGDEPGDEPPGLVVGVLLPGLPALGEPLPGLCAAGEVVLGVLLSVPGTLLSGLPAAGEVPPGLPELALFGAEVEGDEPPGLVVGVLLPVPPPLGALVPGLPAPGEEPPGLPGLPGLPLPGAEVDGDEPGDKPGDVPPGLPGTELVVVELGVDPPEFAARPPANAPGGAVVKVPEPLADAPLLLLTV